MLLLWIIFVIYVSYDSDPSFVHPLCICKSINPLTDTFTNSEDPDEMPHDAAFHQDLHRLLR